MNAARPNPARELDDQVAVVSTSAMGVPSFVMFQTVVDGEPVSLDTLGEAVLGWISFESALIGIDEIEVRQIARAVAKRGYGPRLYEHAMHWAVEDEGVNGVTPGSRVSPEASRVWLRFSARPDYHSEELPNKVEVRWGDGTVEERDWNTDGAWLNAFYRPTGPVAPDLAAARERGEQLVEAWQDASKLWPEEIETHVYEAGAAMYDTHARGVGDELRRILGGG